MNVTQDLSCQEFVELVTGYLEETLPPEIRESFEAHLRICDGCEIYLGQMRLTVRSLARLRATPLSERTRATLAEKFKEWRENPRAPSS
jgi:cell wall assembly regulator SMI1